MTNKYYLMLANILENGRMQSNKKRNILYLFDSKTNRVALEVYNP